MQYNNLGGMGPNFRDPKEIRYQRVTKVGGDYVDLVITAEGEVETKPTGGRFGRFSRFGRGKGGMTKKNPYLAANENAKEFGTNGKAFIAKYNGDSFRTDVMAIGSLAKGKFEFKFSFVNSKTGAETKVPYVPMTFFDLDGKDTLGGKSFEEVHTFDAEGMEYVDGSLVTHQCKRTKKGQFCSCESAKEEIAIPPTFDDLSDQTRKASITMFFKQKSSFTLTYGLNYPHRVFLFKGQCFD